MNNFDWTKFTRKIAIEASKQALYDAWVIPAEIEQWFLSHAEYFTSEGTPVSKTEAVSKGLTYQWQWYLYDVTETGTITKANGKDHFQFTFAGNCKVDVTFKEYKKGTLVSLTQSGIPTDDESKQNIRLGCDNGWSFYLLNLKSVYEGGLDLRNKDPELKPMLNN
jgi:uncharacterized protein YndB with AHSA1/START domain